MPPAAERPTDAPLQIESGLEMTAIGGEFKVTIILLVTVQPLDAVAVKV